MNKEQLKNIIIYCLYFNNINVYCNIINENQYDYFNGKVLSKKRNTFGIRISIDAKEKHDTLIIDKENIRNAYTTIDFFMKKNNIKKKSEPLKIDFKRIIKNNHNYSKNKIFKKIKNIYFYLKSKINSKELRVSFYEKRTIKFITKSQKNVIEIENYMLRILTNYTQENGEKYFKSLDFNNLKKYNIDNYILNYCNTIINDFYSIYENNISFNSNNLIFSNRCGILFHEIYGHLLEYYISYNNNFELVNDLSCNKITIIDDPTIPNLFGSFEYDDDGNKSQRKVLMKKGKIIRYLTSKDYNNDGSNGNARCEDFHYMNSTRMSNTYIKANKGMKDEEMILQIKDGIYVEKNKKRRINSSR